MKNERIKDILCILIFAFVLILGLRLKLFQKEEQRKIMPELISLASKGGIHFKIYPAVTIPIGDFLTFNQSDSLVQDFFGSIQDTLSYSRNHDTIASNDYVWFLEIYTDNADLAKQIGFYIPSGKKRIVVGELGKWQQGNGTGTRYGYFQSRQLYHWYQKYSHRWLELEKTPPTPAPQPDAPGGE